MTPDARLASLRAAWERGALSFPRLVLELGSLIDEAELTEAAGKAAFHAWGQLEIINALTLDSGTALSIEDSRDARAELDRLGRSLSEGHRG